MTGNSILKELPYDRQRRIDNLYINVKENNSFAISNDFSYL